MGTELERARHEIAWLERLYALPSGETAMESNNERLVIDLLKDMELAEQRVGKDNFGACFSCGLSVPTADCTCPYPESFSCVGHKFCAECRQAREKIARHLQNMFAAKISARASSIRTRAYNRLARATDTEGLRGGQRLRSCLFKFSDPYLDEKADLEKNVLYAFKRSGFSDFRGLAKTVQQIEDEYLVMRIANSGLFSR